VLHKDRVHARVGESCEDGVQRVAVVAEVGQEGPDEGIGPDPRSVKLGERAEPSARQRRAHLEEPTETVVRGGDGEADLGPWKALQDVDVAQNQRRLGENSDDAGVGLPGERFEDPARQPVLLLGALIGDP
jgi:hypothetical protein